MSLADREMNITILSAAHGHADSYARALYAQPGVDLEGLWDANARRGQAKAEEYFTWFEEDLDTALEVCDAVIICSENVRHKELTLKAAAAGKHVLCEKPLAPNVEDAREMVRACREAGVLLGTAFPVRQAFGVWELQDAIQGGALGDLLMIRGTNRGTNPGGWFVDPALSGGGAIMDHTVHVADAIRFVTGQEIERVYAEADTRFYPDLAVEDCGLLTMDLSGGAFATLDPSWSRPNKAFPTWGDVTMQVTGTGGVATFDYGAQHNRLYSNDRVRAAWEMYGDDPDSLMVADFVEAVRQGRPPLATGEDGLRAVEVVAAAYESVKTGRPAQVVRE